MEPVEPMAAEAEERDDGDDFVDDEEPLANAHDASQGGNASNLAVEQARAKVRTAGRVRASGNKRSHSDNDEDSDEDSDEEDDENSDDELISSEEGESDSGESYKPDESEDEEEDEDEDEDEVVLESDDNLDENSDGDLESLADSEFEDDDEAQEKHEAALMALLQDKIDSVDALCELLGLDTKQLSQFVGAGVILRNISPMEHMSFLLMSEMIDQNPERAEVSDRVYCIGLCERVLRGLRLMGLETDDLDMEALASALHPLRHLQLKKRETFLHEALKLVPDGGVVCKVLLHLDAAMAIVIGAHAASAARTLAHQKREAAGALLEVVFGDRHNAEMAEADPLAEQASTTTSDELQIIQNRVLGWIQSANSLSDDAFVRRVMLNIAQLSQKPRALRRAKRNIEREQTLPIYKGYYDDLYKYHVDSSAKKRHALAIRIEVRLPSDNTDGWLDHLKINTTHFRLRYQGQGLLSIQRQGDRPGATAGIAAMSYVEGVNPGADHALTTPPQADDVQKNQNGDGSKRRKLVEYKPPNTTLAANLLQTALNRPNMKHVVHMIHKLNAMAQDEKPVDSDVHKILCLKAHPAVESAATSKLQTLPALDEDLWVMTARVRGGKYLKPFRGMMCSSVHPVAWARLAKTIAKYHGLVTVVLAPKILIKSRRFGATYDRRVDERFEK